MRSLHHPWTLGLATGRTSRASFKKYVAQDAYFLRAFAKAYAYALIKTEDEEGVRAFHSLIGSVLAELRLHSSYAMKWGVDLKNVSDKKLLVPDAPAFIRKRNCTSVHSALVVVVENSRQHASYVGLSMSMGARLGSLDFSDVSQPRVNQNPPPVRATTEYVNFLLAVASDPTSSVAQVLAAMVPCMRLYAFLGKVR